VLFTANTIGTELRAAGMNEIALQRGLPVGCRYRQDVEAGCLMTYQAAADFQSHRAAYFVDKILRGSKPGELPIEQPSQFQFVVNLRTAEALGLTFPTNFAAQVTEWIK
jgi:putative ABC transport system substrate-binding protein